MAGNYRCAIPQTPDVVDVVTRATIIKAPAIANNTPRNLNDLVAASIETRSLKRAREEGGRITDAELARAQVREHAVASELAAANYHAAGVPPWAIQMRNAIIQKLQTEIQTVKSEIRRRLAHLIERSLLNSNLSCSFSARAMQSPEA